MSEGVAAGLAEVQKVLGHANLATTAIYLHVRDDDLAAKVKALGE